MDGEKKNVISSFLIMILLEESSITLKPVLTINNDTTPQLTYSYDAVYLNNRLYVADDSFSILIFDKNGTLIRKIGQKGQGPKDFTNPPERLEIIGDQIHVREMQGWTLHIYNLEGDFIRKEKTHPGITKLKGVSYKKLPSITQPCKGFRFQNEANQCLYGETLCDSNMDLHISTSFLVSGKERIYVVKRRGAIEVYEGCLQIKNIELPLEKFKREITEDFFGTSLARALEPGTTQKKYKFGLPVISAAVESEIYLWVLVGDEHSQDKYRHATRTSLFRCNMESGEFDHKVDSKRSIDHIQIRGKYLTLNSAYEGEVSVFLIDSKD